MDVERLKQSVSMLEVVQRYGLKVNRAGFCSCPFHSGDNTPSMKIYPKSFYCFACGAGGDQINFVRKMENIDFREACRKLGGEEVQMNDANKARIVQKKKAAAEQARKEARLKEAFFHACRDLRTEEYIRDHCEVGGPAWVEAVNEIPKAGERADELLEMICARLI